MAKSKSPKKSKVTKDKNKEVLSPDVESNPVGCPTKYDPKYAKEFLDYFSVKPYEKRKKKVIVKGVPLEIEVDDINDMPTLAGFAIKIGVHRDTLHEWVKKHPEFSDAYKRAKDFQEHYIVTNGLRGYTKDTFTQFVAVNVLNWRTKAKDEADLLVIPEQKLSEAELLAKAQELLTKLGLNKK